MTYHTDTDRIPATADATMMHILTHGFSSPEERRHGFRAISGGTIKRVSGRIGRTENGWWHKDTGDMSVSRERRQAAKKRADDALLAEELRGLLTAPRSKHRVMRQIEVVRVRTTKDGTRHVVGRQFCNVECKLRRQK